MLLVILLLLSVVAFASLLMPLLYATEVYRVRRGRRAVTCPEIQQSADVEIDAVHSALTSLRGTEYMRLRQCSRWPDRKQCDQDCVSELFEPREVAATCPAALPHLAVFTGAGLAWLLGAVWYADPVFGQAWMRVHGLTQEAARARAEMIVPYLVPGAGFLLLGYLIAFAQRRSRRLGVLQATVMGVAACAAFLVIDLLLGSSLPGNWLPLSWVEIAYGLFGSAVTAAVVSGWPSLQQRLRA